MFVKASNLNPIAIAFIIEVFFVADVYDSLVIFYFLAKKHAGIHFRVNSEHYLFLNCSMDEGSTSDILIGKISFEGSIMFFDIFTIVPNLYILHFYCCFLAKQRGQSLAADNPSEG